MPKKMRRRYLALKIDGDDSFRSGELMEAVWDAVLKLYGEYGASHTHLSLIKYDDQKRVGILRTGHTTVDMIRAALASITQIGGKPAAVHLTRVSGTIKALHSKTEPKMK